MSALIRLPAGTVRQLREIPVLFEDEHLLALNKPAGLWTSPDRDDPQRPSLMRLLHAGIAEGKPWAVERGLVYLMNAHRLDPETSGVLLLAKTKPTLMHLTDWFGAGKPGRVYLALARGAPPEERFEIDARIAPHPVRAGVMHVDTRRGKRARTLVQVLERFSNWVLLRCEPLTVRIHQVRVHLRHAGLPIVADVPYGGRPLFLSQLKQDYRAKKDESERPLMGRVALHAEALRLPHPVTGRPLVLTAPWPKDLFVAVKYLRKFGRLNV